VEYVLKTENVFKKSKAHEEKMKEVIKMKKIKLVMLIFIIFLCPIMLVGCWNYREIDSLAIVTGIAIDKDMITKR